MWQFLGQFPYRPERGLGVIDGIIFGVRCSKFGYTLFFVEVALSHLHTYLEYIRSIMIDDFRDEASAAIPKLTEGFHVGRESNDIFIMFHHRILSTRINTELICPRTQLAQSFRVTHTMTKEVKIILWKCRCIYDEWLEIQQETFDTGNEYDSVRWYRYKQNNPSLIPSWTGYSDLINTKKNVAEKLVIKRKVKWRRKVRGVGLRKKSKVNRGKVE